MKKNLINIFTLSALLFATSVHAQYFNYNFASSTGTYTPLSGTTSSMNGTTVWDSSANFSGPVGFNFNIGAGASNVFYLNKVQNLVFDTSTNPVIEGFMVMDANLIDKGAGTSTSLSPLTYQVSGTTGSRISKIQISNAGFANERKNHGTLNDYINLQIWLYEGTSTVEYHFGSSSITPAYYGDYFRIGGFPEVGYGYRKDLSGNGVVYYPGGAPTSPEIDSEVFNSYVPTSPTEGLLGYPANGTIYTFYFHRLGVDNIPVNVANIYPTSCTNNINVKYESNEPTNYTVVAISGATTTINGVLKNGITHIDVNTLPAGMYLMQLQNSTGRSTQKFIKL